MIYFETLISKYNASSRKIKCTNTEGLQFQHLFDKIRYNVTIIGLQADL